MDYKHIPVLLKEVLEILNPQAGQNFVDATLGGGGYSKAIIEKVKPNGKLLSIDLDLVALENIKFQISNIKNWQIVHGNFRDIDKAVVRHKFPVPNGIVADLGLSSYQLDQSERGISFQKKELLDMRFDQSQEQEDAKFILNNYSIDQLIKIFKEYGEEKFAAQIARKVQETRTKNQIKFTSDLYQVIKDALPKPLKHRADDSARRVFQALRIAVNHELENLQEFLPKAFGLLAPGGRLAVVSFHSLEDRLVKKYFTGLSKGCVCPPDFPICRCGRNPQARLLNKKPITASPEEIKNNPRSKPAKLRAVEKL
ncbi:MAG: 16S rRNA (cytosine(1402)-N(4))-methyltransferase RsmH [Patescibacteria group bacterium]|nr:16S rRNA (cytosine(1402)-N(4))-methyltransferase RsmH [Patescibacteria group bacterium]